MQNLIFFNVDILMLSITQDPITGFPDLSVKIISLFSHIVFFHIEGVVDLLYFDRKIIFN